MFTRLIYLVSFVLVSCMFVSVANADIQTGLAGYWPLNEGMGDTTADMSGNGHEGTLYNGATWITPGFMGNAAVNVDGNPGSRVSVGTWDPGERLSLAIWARWTGEQNKAPRTGLIGKRDNWSAEAMRWFSEVMTSGEVRMRNYTQTISSPPGAMTAFIDEWAHVAITFDGTTVIIYLNAEEVGSGPFTLGPHVAGAMGLGCKQGASNSSTETFSGDIDEARVYTRALSAADVRQLFEWRGIAGKAYGPIPTDGQTDVPRDVVPSWTPGEFASAVNGHVVYLSKSFNDVSNGVGGVTVSTNSYAPAQRLDFETTYYWRVDEVNAPPDSTVFKGNVWSFTTEPVGYPIDGANITATASSVGQADFGPEKTIDGSGLNAEDLHSVEATDMWLSGNEPGGAWIQYEFDTIYKLHEMWVWNANQTFEALFGFGMKDVTVEYSTNGIDWTALAGVPEFSQAPGTAGYAHNTTIDFGGAVARYVKLTATSNWGGVLPQYGLSEVRFFYIPVIAREPAPADGAADVNPAITLTWRSGRDAATHNVYLSTDEQAVIDGNVPAVSVTGASYSSALDLGSTYYWRVDEVNEAETPTTWQGDVWSFSTPEYLAVDDFEDYNDYPPYEVYTTWVDGYQNPANGSQVGYLTLPSVETTIVHSGKQSMPLLYSNTGGATYSEATRTFAVPQNWTRHGIATLVLYFQGVPGNTGQLYVKVNGAKVTYPGDAADIAKPSGKQPWQQWNIDLASLSVNPASITSLAIGIDGNGAAGTLYVDDIVLYRFAPPKPSEEIYIEAETADPLGASWRVYTDPLSWGGSHIGSEDGDGDDNDTAPGAGWIATYNFNATGGTYKVLLRAQERGSDSFWVRITTATSQTHEDPDQPGTGWVRFNGIDALSGWAWDEVHSDDHGQAVVNWTLPAGQNTIEIGKREDGVWLDALLIATID